ncbi:hypothetical protein IKG20_01840 [Candidatus Saccharibacteria bacterium]|nr:hypothetical protein [Candidatus Saccharibacteria bacterium]
MPEPKKQSSPRKTGLRRSHIRLDLARAVNKVSPVKAFETKKQTPRVKVKTVKPAKTTSVKAAKKAATKSKLAKKSNAKKK